MMLIPRGNYGLNLLDDFFNDPFFTSSSEKQAPAQKMPIMRTDILEQEGNYILEIELPGYGKDEIQAELKDGYLTVTAQHAHDRPHKHSTQFLNIQMMDFFLVQHVSCT